MAIHTRFGSSVTIIAYDEPWVTVRYEDGETREQLVSDLRAEGGIQEIMAAITALAGALAEREEGEAT